MKKYEYHIWFIFLVGNLLFLISCASTKKQLVHSFNKSFYYDTAYFKIILPLYTKSPYWNDTLLALTERGYMRLSDDKRAAAADYPLYEVTTKGQKYLLGNYVYEQRDKDDQYAMFQYYKLKAVRINKYQRISKDSTEVILKASYIVNPMFAIASNPLYIKALFIKSSGSWELQDAAKIISAIYRVDNERWWQGGAFLATDRYWDWRNNGYKK